VVADITVPQTSWLGFKTTWTAPQSYSYITVQVLNNHPGPSGDFVSRANVDNICISPAGTDCRTNIVENGEFTKNNVPGDSSMPPATATPWVPSSGSPQVYNTMGDGNLGWSFMWGNQAVGESISQKRAGMFKRGVTYRMTVSLRYHPDPEKRVNPHVWLRVRLSNGSPGYTQPDQAGVQKTVAQIGNPMHPLASIPAASGPGITHTEWVLPDHLPSRRRLRYADSQPRQRLQSE
jgi:hypothetical protein